MISEFDYQKITECIYARSCKTKIGVTEVNPAYTSQIGRLKYMRRKGINIHSSAAYVIGRRGMGYKEKVCKEYRKYIEEGNHHWSSWSMISKKMKNISSQELLMKRI